MPDASSLRLYPTDITVLPFVDDIDSLGVRVPENQKIVTGTAAFDSGIIDAHRLRRNFVRPDNPR